MITFQIGMKAGGTFTVHGAAYRVNPSGTLVVMPEYDSPYDDAIFRGAPGEWAYIRVMGPAPTVLNTTVSADEVIARIAEILRRSSHGQAR